MRGFIGLISGLVLTLCASAAFAVPVTYTVSGGSFAGGGNLTGGFTYDADTNTYSAINLVTTAGGAYPGQTYIATNGAFSTASVLVVVTSAGAGSGQPVMALGWGAPLTNAGGSTGITTPNSAEGYCDPVCGTFSATPTRQVNVGAVITSVAPVPTLSEWAATLFGWLLVGAAFMTMRRRRA